jgi:glycosyltransferase involved in cell wall biosynthesis
LATRVRALALDEVVQFVGPVAGEQKTRLLQAADVLLLPSYSEGLPYALLEAMASGMPAVTCPVGAIPDVMQDGKHGLLVPPRDRLALAKAIAALDDDRLLLDRMGKAARQRVRAGFLVEHLAANFAGLYQEMIDAAT